MTFFRDLFVFWTQLKTSVNVSELCFRKVGARNLDLLSYLATEGRNPDSVFVQLMKQQLHAPIGVVLDFVLPETKNSPALRDKLARYLLVPDPICLNLPVPVGSSRIGPTIAIGTAMPKASIEKDRDPPFPEDNVRFPRERVVKAPPTNSRPGEQRPEPSLG